MKRKGNRGSALLVVAYLGVVLAGVVGIYFYRSSQTASTDSQQRESIEGARNTAEYALELAQANLADMKYETNAQGVRTSVIEDWVMINPYGSTGEAATERRIGGSTNDYDYRVLVRSVRLARESDTMPKGWLSNVNPESYDWGTDPLRKFSGAYEIIASAKRPGEPRAALASEATVRTVVNMDYHSSYNTLEEIATLHVTDPEKLNIGDLYDPEDDGGSEGGGGQGGGSGGEVNGLKPGENQILVSGEDHYAVKAAVKDVVEEKVIEGLAALPKLPSQLYSVVNSIWDQGKMTLHFQNGTHPNPNVPRTPTFSTSNIDRTMVALRPDDPKMDEYVFGGKRVPQLYSNTSSDPNYYSKPVESGSNIIYGYGRSVTILEDGLIKETSGAQATPSLYAESALAVGSVENMLRFYLNFVDQNYPAASATAAAVDNWKTNGWRQLPLGYHTKNRTKNAQLREYRRPLDNRLSDARRRWTILLWIKDKNGRFLVRDHTSWRTNSSYYSSESGDTMRTSYPYPMSKWTGRYRWAMYGGYGSGTNSDGGHYHIGNFSATNQHAGTKQTLHTRILTLEELLGYQMYVDKDGVPAKVNESIVASQGWPSNRVLTDSQIVAGVPDYYLVGGEKVPYEKNGCQFDEDYQRQNRTDNYGRASSFSYATDGLYVYDDVTKQQTKYETLKDFAFEIDISTDGTPDIREVVTLHMVFENTAEVNSSSPNMYFDMGLTVTIVYPKKVSGAVDDDFLEEAFRQWWEGDSEESLTGKTSHFSISTVPDGILIGMTEDTEKMKTYYKQFGFYDPTDENRVVDSVYTMVDSSNGKTGFAKAEFLADGTLDYDRAPAGYTTYYYGRDNLYEYMSFNPELYRATIFAGTMSQADLDALLADPERYNEELLEWRKTVAVQQMKSNNSGKDFLPLPERFDEPDNVEAKLSMTSTQSLLIPNRAITVRDFALDAFGFKNMRVPALYAKWNADETNLQRMRYSDLNDGGTSDEIPAAQKIVSFLPGEIQPNPASPGSLEPDPTQSYMDMMARTTPMKQPNGREIKPIFIWDTADTPDELDMSKIHDYPLWFLGRDPAEEDINGRDLSIPMHKKYPYPQEHRGALGWHREGPTPTVPSDTGDLSAEEYKLVYGDSYEFVIIGQKGFNPYYEMRDDGKNHVAAIRPDTDEKIHLEDCTPTLKDAKDMPTFVLEGSVLDGAGIVVVNGNLEVKTDFAYHGVLVVLGDLVVTPAEYMALNANKQPYDAEGNELFESGGQWFYLGSNSERVRSYPVMQWRGSVVVQGKVLVGGEIITKMIDGHPGVVDIRSSTQAIEDTMGVWIHAAPNEGFEYDRLGWTSGTDSSDYGLWKENE